MSFTQKLAPFPQAEGCPQGREESAPGSSPSITSIPRAGRQHRAPAHLLAAGTVLGKCSSAAARLNEQGAGTATRVQGFPEQQAQLPEKVEVQFYSSQILWFLKPGEVMVVPPGTSQPGLRVDLSPPISRPREGRNTDVSIRWETSSLSLSPTLAGKEAAEDTDTGRLVTAEQDTWGCSWGKKAIC